MHVTVGVVLVPQRGTMADLRRAWMQAEALGADRLYSVDHFHAQVLETEAAEDGQIQRVSATAYNFEGTMTQAAMAATTSRAEIGCIVHGIGYRNPNLLADMARTMDHISGGRFILGLGSGYLKPDYDEYGYEYGTQKSRLLDLKDAIPVIKSRFAKLNPAPLRKIPLLIASMGEQIGMRIVAEHADMWHVYGPIDKVRHKCEVLRRYCDEIGRDFNEIELTTFYLPQLLKSEKNSLQGYLDLGITHVICVTEGPNWDLSQVRDLVAWRDAQIKG